MTTLVTLNMTPQKIVDCKNFAIITARDGKSFRIATGETLPDKSSSHPVREIGFGCPVIVWAWIDTLDPVYVDVSQG